MERDGWVPLLARYPERAIEWLKEKRASLADPEFQRLYRGYEEAVGRDPAEPRLELADDIVHYLEQRYDEGVSLKWDLDDPTVAALLASHFGNASSPAVERPSELAEGKRASRRRA